MTVNLDHDSRKHCSWSTEPHVLPIVIIFMLQHIDPHLKHILKGTLTAQRTSEQGWRQFQI
jgi:hypothetical protein